MSNLEGKEYFIGLDCGTDSVGYAVTDTEYNILKFNGKAMWGSHIFDAAQPASARRTARCARRRLERRRQRLDWLQSLFAEEIYKIDPTFFIRLNDSKYLMEDKESDSLNILFNDSNFKDKDFFKKYPTIYHLRMALMEGEVTDPRMLYLGIAHILKHRGHFLFPGESFASVLDLGPITENVKDAIRDTFELEMAIDVEKVEEALKVKSSRGKQEELVKAIDLEDSKLKTNITKVIVGYKVSPQALFGNEEYAELPSIEFQKASFEEADLPTLEEGLSDDEYKLVVNLKALFDWALLVSVVPIKEGCTPSISRAKVQQFEVNKIQLRALKDAVKKYCPGQYEEFFHSKEKGSFSTYVGKNHDSRKSKKFRVRRSNTDDFYKKIRSMLKPFEEDKCVKFILDAMDNNEFLPLLSSFRNSVIPYQLNKLELDEILSKARDIFPFLDEKDEDGYSVWEKIVSLLTFRIPYYVGPLGKNAEHEKNNAKNRNRNLPWMERKATGRITPWNFDEKVDCERSAEKFIERMTNKCTYCREEDVLPKQSIAYSKYMVLNELNNLRIQGYKLDVEHKQQIFENLFKKYRKVTKKKIITFGVNEGWFQKGEIKDDDITGIDGDFKASMSSYIDFHEFIDSKKLSIKDADRIIKWITVFSEGGEMLKSKVRKEYGKVLSPEDINKICRLKYAGWGRFSNKYLFELKAYIPELHEETSVIEAMWNTQYNQMELMSGKYAFRDLVDEPQSIGKLDYSVVDELYASPAVKKQIWQALKIVDEIQRIMKHPPKKVFVEVTRSEGEKKATVSRKNDLIKKLKDAEKSGLGYDIEFKKLIDDLTGKEESAVSRQDKLYLYFSQCGKCMYSGEPIVLDDLYKTNIYDIDHIYPYSKSNDDSLTNRVLVKKECNARKTNEYPISDDVRNKMAGFWKALAEKGFIPKEKYQRLVRCTPLTDEDTEGFISRQIVETSQTAKATIEILKAFFGESTKLVYSKARNVSAFRQEFEFPKCRTMNNLHHAKDAYLNIVVGNILDVKYTSEFFRYGGENAGYYNLSKPFDYRVANAWDVERVPLKDEDGKTIRDKNNRETYAVVGKDIETVRKTMRRNNIQYTVQPTSNDGQLYDLQIVPKGSKNGALPTKPSDPRLSKGIYDVTTKNAAYDVWTNKYGGYNSLSTAYFALVSNTEKKKEYISFIPISIVDARECETDEGLLNFCTTRLGLQNVRLIRHKILKNTILEFNGFPMGITGKSGGGSKITLNSMVALILSHKSELVLKHIESFQRKKKESKITIDPVHDGITDDDVIELYKEIIQKNALDVYGNRPGQQKAILNEGKLESFTVLPLEEKCTVIEELMNYLGMGCGQANLTLIGGSKACGTITKTSRQRIGDGSIVIIDKSITGLFETRTKVSE